MSKDDARITAYVLGELSDSKKAAFETELANSPELQVEVDAIRAFTELLEDELVVEECPQLENSQRKEVLDLLEEPQIKKFPKWTVCVSFAAALIVGCFLVWLVLDIVNTKEEFVAVAEKGGVVVNKSAPVVASKPVSVSSDSYSQTNSDHGRRMRLRKASESLSKQEELQQNLSDSDLTEDALLSLEREEAEKKAYHRDVAAKALAEKKEMAQAAAKKKKASMTQYSQTYTESMKRKEAERRAMEAKVRAAKAKLAKDFERAESLVRVVGSAAVVTQESYPEYIENIFEKVEQKPLSTFSIDVDNASYTNLRSQLNRGYIPHKDSIRIEEMINYFDYDYPEPESNRPFSVNLEMAQSPWSLGNQLVRIGLKGKDVKVERRPNCNLVFLIDVSGSMSASNKLPLLKEGFQKMVAQLTEKDRVGIVVYAGNAGVVLNPTICDQRGRDLIIGALGRLNSGGSTNGAGGIKEAYKLVQQNFMPGGVNRVILATDGDFNVGTSSTSGLVELVKQKAKEKAYLTVLGFGRGNLNDRMMEEISNKGNGNYFYIDSAQESTRVLCEKINGTLVTIAKDVKIQVEFNPALVHSYRLIGYDNRKLKDRDFNDDKKDAGEIGAGHTVTAIYEVVPVGSPNARPEVDQLKYQPVPEKKKREVQGEFSDELMTVKLRYKAPQGGPSTLISYPLKNKSLEFSDAPRDFIFASSVAAFGMLAKESDYAGNVTVDEVIKWIQSNGATKNIPMRNEFMNLLRQFQKIKK